MTTVHIQRDTLGPDATQEDADRFATAVEYLLDRELVLDQDQAEQVVWGDGNFLPRIERILAGLDPDNGLPIDPATLHQPGFGHADP